MSNRYADSGPASSDSSLAANSRWRAVASCTQLKTGSSTSAGESAKNTVVTSRRVNPIASTIRFACGRLPP